MGGVGGGAHGDRLATPLRCGGASDPRSDGAWGLEFPSSFSPYQITRPEGNQAVGPSRTAQLAGAQQEPGPLPGAAGLS